MIVGCPLEFGVELDAGVAGRPEIWKGIWWGFEGNTLRSGGGREKA